MFNWPVSRRKDIFGTRLLIIELEVSTFPIVVTFSIAVCLRWLYHHILSVVSELEVSTFPIVVTYSVVACLRWLYHNILSVVS